MLNKIYLDSEMFRQLAGIGLSEGLVTRDSVSQERLLKNDVNFLAGRKTQRSRLLRALVLFDEIDADYSQYDLTNLVSRGLFSDSSNVRLTSQGLRGDPQLVSNADRGYYALCSRISAELIAANKKNILDYHLAKSPRDYYTKGVQQELSRSPSLTDFIVTNSLDIGRIDADVDERNVLGSILSSFYFYDYYGKISIDSLMQSIQSLSQTAGSRPFDLPMAISPWVAKEEYEKELGIPPQLWAIAEDLFFYHQNLTNVLYRSQSQAACVGSIFSKLDKSRENKELKLIDDVEILAKTTFADELKILPSPNSISDVLKMREHRSIRRFREVISEWMRCISECDVKGEVKMRSDLRTANRDLRLLSKYQEYNQSRLSFWVNTVGGHIPFFSNVLTASNTIAHVGEKKLRERSSWRILGRV